MHACLNGTGGGGKRGTRALFEQLQSPCERDVGVWMKLEAREAACFKVVAVVFKGDTQERVLDLILLHHLFYQV